MKRPFTPILVLVAFLILVPAAQAQEAAENSEATTPATTDADMQPTGSTVTLKDFMGEIRALMRIHLDVSEKAAQAHMAALDKNIENWKTVGGTFMALLALFGFGGLWSLFRYAREQARIRADKVIDRELEKRMAEATAQIHGEFEKLVGEYEARIQDLVGAETQATMEEMENLREDLVQLRPHEAPEPEAILEPIASSPEGGGVPVEREAQWQKMKYALLNHKFVWRSIERLARAADITPQLAESILQEHSHEVRISRGKSGRTIARHQSRQPK
jgi:hypothetical protein